MYDNWSADWCLSRDPQERVDNETRHLRLDAATRVRGERRKRKEKWKSREEESFGGGEKKKEQRIIRAIQTLTALPLPRVHLFT